MLWLELGHSQSHWVRFNTTAIVAATAFEETLLALKPDVNIDNAFFILTAQCFTFCHIVYANVKPGNMLVAQATHTLRNFAISGS